MGHTRTLVCVVALAGALTWSACAGQPPRPPDRATVTEIVDGDTLVVEVDGRVESIRLLGLDTPETRHPTRPVECFGPEATDELAELIPPGTEVRLERDAEPRDRYGRLLVYVFRVEDGLFVNHELVATGHGRVLLIGPNRARAADLRRAEAEARAAAVGLWGACGG